MEAIRADDIVALNGFQRSVAVAAELDHGVVGIDVANSGAADAEDDVSALRHPAADKILEHLVLRINNDSLAIGQSLNVDVMALPVPLQGNALVEVALAQHAFAQPEVLHQFDDPVLQHTGANGFLDVVTASGFDNNCADPSAMQQMRQE